MVASGENPGCGSSMARPRKKDKHLPPCVYRRHGAFWYVKAGKWSRLGATLEEALTAYAGLVGSAPSGGAGGMVRLIDQVLKHIKPTVAPGTFRQYQMAARHAKTRLVEFDPEDVQTTHIADIKLDMVDTPNMANRVITILHIVFAQACEWQLLTYNPARAVKPFKEAKRERYITDDEYRAIYAEAPPRLQVTMDLLYYTAQRVSDVLGVRRADLTPEGLRFKQRKTGEKLLVAWSPELELVVERAKGLHGAVHALTLLKGRKGKPPNYRSVADQWRRACEAAGVEDAQLRDLRAKAITDADRQGLDATALAGHASEKMTDRYIRQRSYPVVFGPSFGQGVQNLSNRQK